MSLKMGSEKIDKTLIDTLNTTKKCRSEGKGYIMMPTDGGFDLFEVGEKRLKHYLDMETVLRSNVDNPPQQSTPVGFITDDDVDNMGNTKEGKFAIVGSGIQTPLIRGHHAHLMMTDIGYLVGGCDFAEGADKNVVEVKVSKHRQNDANIAVIGNVFGTNPFEIKPPSTDLLKNKESHDLKVSQTEYMSEERCNHKRLSAGHGNKKRNKKKRK